MNDVKTPLSFWKRLWKKTWKPYVIFTGVLVVLTVAALIYVGSLVSEYSAAQPEEVVKNVISEIREKLAAGEASEYLALEKSASAYEVDNVAGYTDAYLKKLDNTVLSFSLDTGAGEGLEKVYTLFANGEKFAKVELSGSNQRSKLFFFSMADWEVSELYSIPFGGGIGDMKIYLPEGIKCTVNGKELRSEDLSEKENGIPVYLIKNLEKTPEIAFTRENGSPLSHTLTGTVVTPAVYNYNLSLPAEISLALDGVTQNGTKTESGYLNYQIASMTKPNVVLSDLFGNTHSYEGGDPPLSRFNVQLPDSFTLKVADYEFAKESGERSENPDEKELAKYTSGIELHDLISYKVFSLAKNAKVEITDNLGKVSEYMLSENSLIITGESGESEMPEELKKKIDPMLFAERWSRFLTNDLGATKREGFNIISGYFTRDSAYYKEALGWISNIDSTFTSAHLDPTFSEKQIRDFIKYNDNCFSVRVSLVKSMYLTRTGETVLDPLDLIVYFANYEGKWIVAVKHDAQQGE